MLGYNSRIRHKIVKFNRRFSGDLPPASPHHTLAPGYLKKVAIQLQFVCWAWVLGTRHCTVGNKMYLLSVISGGDHMSYLCVGSLYLLKSPAFKWGSRLRDFRKYV